MNLILSIFILTMVQGAYLPEGNSSMQLEIQGLRNTKGHVLIAIFKSADGFPDVSDKAFRKERLVPVVGKMMVEIKNLPAGNYAIALVHDENDNMQLDTGLFGIPKEGFCFSKDAMGTFGPPSFESAAIVHNQNSTSYKLNVNYW